MSRFIDTPVPWMDNGYQPQVEPPQPQPPRQHRFPKPIPVSELEAVDESKMDWFWEGFLAPGHSMLLVGFWKAGKSTLLAHVMKAMGAGAKIVGQVDPTRVLLVSEEGAGLLGGRLQRIGVGDHVLTMCRPFNAKPGKVEWEEFVNRHILSMRDQFDVLILDTFANVSPLLDENDAAKAQQALMPLNVLLEDGAAVLIVHHSGKGDADQARSSRGSSALPAFVDVITELRRYDAKSLDDTRRVLRSYSRFETTPDELVLEYDPATGFRSIGTKADASRDDRAAVIHEVLRDEAMTAEEIRAAWPEGTIPKPAVSTISRLLNDPAYRTDWTPSGAGKRGDPYRFRRIRT